MSLVKVSDPRLLISMTMAGHLQWPATKDHADLGQPYVTHSDDRPRRFIHKDVEYQIKYVDGCFYPFVFRQQTYGERRADAMRVGPFFW